MNKTNVNLTSPSQEILNNLLEHCQNQRFNEAEKLATSITKKFPKHQFTWKVLGIIFGELNKNSEAVKANQTAISLSPEDHEAHNNLGIALKNLDRLEEAEKSYEQAIKLKPDLADAYNNLGVALQELGRLEEAMNNFIKAIKLNPSLAPSARNMAGLLSFYAPQDEVSHPILKANQEIKKNYFKEKTSEVVSDDKIIQLFCKSSDILKSYNLKLKTSATQIYRRNSIDLNCRRHKTIFNKFNIIPKFCFGCYKVQVEPLTVLELIKLFIVFDQIKFDKNNTRKCMIEMRPEISGFYKGLIYCSSLEEANQIENYLEVVLKKNIRSGLNAVVKRGCAEYPTSFPDYKEINKSGPQLMNYNEEWKSIEKDYDLSSLIRSKKIITPSLSGLNFHDILIIQNWIDYAKGIGDPSVHLFNQAKVFSSEVYKNAKIRIKNYPWQGTH